MSGVRGIVVAAAASLALHGAAAAALRALGLGPLLTPSSATAPLVIDLIDPVVARPPGEPLAPVPPPPAPPPGRKRAPTPSTTAPGSVPLSSLILGLSNQDPNRQTDNVSPPERLPSRAPSPPVPGLVAPPSFAVPPPAAPGAVADAAGVAPFGAPIPSEAPAAPRGTAAPDVPPGTGTAATGAPGSGGSSLGGTAVPPEYDEYVRALRQRIQDRLAYPWLAVRQRLQGVVDLEVRVDREGRLARATVVGGEEAELLRAAALKAAREAMPLAFPPGVPPRPLAIRLPVVFVLR